MLKNGTRTEKCWSLLRGRTGLSSSNILGFLNLCLYLKLFIFLKLSLIDLHVCHTGLDKMHVVL